MWQKLWLSLISIGMSCCMFAAASAAAGQPAANPEEKPEAAVNAAAPEVPSEKIYINLASRSLALYVDGVKVALYPIGPGKVSTPTPLGSTLISILLSWTPSLPLSVGTGRRL